MLIVCLAALAIAASASARPLAADAACGTHNENVPTTPEESFRVTLFASRIQCDQAFTVIDSALYWATKHEQLTYWVCPIVARKLAASGTCTNKSLGETIEYSYRH